MITEPKFRTLQPFISNETMFFHYEKHHKGYFENLKKIYPQYNEHSLEDILKNTQDKNLWNNAAQVWNHNFFWNSLALEQKNERVKQFIYGKINLYQEFISKSKGFGSGWVWLLYNNEKFEVVFTTNGNIPSGYPLLVLDCWEHAYYLDYKNDRNGFVIQFLEHLINWDFIELRLKNIGINI